jgi:hypothetical protein
MLADENTLTRELQSMSNGTQSKIFLGEIAESNDARNRLASPVQLMSPTLRAALDELEQQLRMFQQSAERQDSHHPEDAGLGTDEKLEN